jgi:hypothetical protein
MNNPCDKCRIPCDIISDECLLTPAQIARDRMDLVRDEKAIREDEAMRRRARSRDYYANQQKNLDKSAAYRLSRKNKREVMAAVKERNCV